MLVPSRLKFERSQQRSPRIAAEVPLLPHQREKKAQKDSPALSSHIAAETEVLAKRRTEKSKRQEAPRETVNRCAPLAMEALETITSIWRDSSIPSSPRASASSIPLQIPAPAPGGETPRSSAFLTASLSLHPQVHVTEGVKLTKKIKGWPAKQQIVNGNGYCGPMEHSRFKEQFGRIEATTESIALGCCSPAGIQTCGGAFVTPGLHPASYAGWIPPRRGGPPHKKRNPFFRNGLNTGLHAAAATISLERL
ncbi:hypothetical protein PoB_000727000 [Plakobranchus ocellatus]|uniref:Uncharacterized protein n=1 Tax=Plakobranchus ocellatus TaxID=259542 RepID=A0AAV3YCJ3_9GAST|nr:hypothetical protein PoB_000727000 [Plakobranchus ocellatus]